MRRGAARGMDMVLMPPRVEASLWRRWRYEAEARCREQIFVRYRSLAKGIAARQLGRRPRNGIELGDMEQFAYEGLLVAIDRFDPLRGIPFSAFARRRIMGSIYDGAARMSEVDAPYSARLRQHGERARSLIDAGADAPSAPSRSSALAAGLAVGLMLAEGVVAAPMDIDLCLILGAGWPFHLGGITPYLDRSGVSERVLGQRFLPKGVATLP